MQNDPVRKDEAIRGDVVGGDKITVGNISDSYLAIGTGAQVIVTQIQQALSATGELEKNAQELQSDTWRKL